MQGSIRVFVGMLIVFGAVGGIDQGSDAQLIPAVLLAIAGLVMMNSGVTAMKGAE